MKEWLEIKEEKTQGKLNTQNSWILSDFVAEFVS